MNLEDHAGDIVRKARAMSGITASSAAEVAGISEAVLAVLEDSGVAKAGLDILTLGSAVGLDGMKLQKIADGWVPAHKDLSMWRELRCVTTDKGMAVNCYLVWDAATREAALFDTGWSDEPLIQMLSGERVELRHIFITHTHSDHVACLGQMQKRYPSAEVHTGGNSEPSGQWRIGNLRVSSRNTPGHAEDGITYVVENWPGSAPGVAIVGDAIFAGSIGRGNISWSLARQKVREEILTLPGETLICPGHGPVTTVTEEKAHNPFF